MMQRSRIKRNLMTKMIRESKNNKKSKRISQIRDNPWTRKKR
jgi:hypothetical protein